MASGSGLITMPPIVLAAEDPPWDDEDPPWDDEGPLGDDHELGLAIDTLPMWVAVGVPPVCGAGVVFGFEAPPVELAYADGAAAPLDEAEVGAATLVDGAVNAAAPLADGPAVGAAAPLADGAVDAAAPLGVGSSM
jgi:hypothetical protein